jgi:hypothetical protein
VISALHLPKPEQAELKANSVDPYVVVQIFGVPRDCDEVRTKTVYHNCKIMTIIWKENCLYERFFR